MTPVTIKAEEIHEQTGKKLHTIYEWAYRAEDPLPLRRFTGGRRGSFAIVEEYEEWLKRNTYLLSEEART